MMDKKNIVMSKVYDVLLEITEKALTKFKKSNTLNDEFLENFSYAFLDWHVKPCISSIKQVTKFLLVSAYRSITETNLQIANQNSNWREFPIERFIAEYLNDFLNYAIPRIINIQDWKETFDDYYQTFEREYLADEFTYECFGHIANFGYEFSDTGKLNDHTKIVVLSSSEKNVKHRVLCETRADYFRVKNRLKFNPTPFGTNFFGSQNFHYFLYHTRKFKKSPISEKRFYFDGIMKKFILAIRLLCNSPRQKPYSDFFTVFHQGNQNSFPGLSMNFPENKMGTSLDYAMVGTPENVWLKRLWCNLEETDYFERLVAFDHHLDDALGRGNRSLRNPWAENLKITDELDRLSNYFSAFDSIYKTRPGNTGEKIANYTSRLVTCKRNPHDNRNPNTWFEVKNFLQGLYKIRNDYEHGRYGIALKKARGFRNFEGAVQTVGFFLREVAILYIMNNDFEQQLAEIAFGDCSKLKSIYYS